MQNKRTLNWGIMGAGLIAKKMAKALAINPDSQLQAIASKTPSKAKRFAAENGVPYALSYQELVSNKEIDVIYVATTHNFHFENARLALEHGKHVLVEKSFTVNAKQARELIRLGREKNLFLMEAMWIRFLPIMITLKNKIQNKEIGSVKVINISFGKFISTEYAKRLKEPALAGGTTLDLGVYPISFICYLLDEFPIEIKSMTRFSDSGVDEIAHYMFRFPSGCLANISMSYNLNMKTEAMIYGEQGYIEFPQFFTGQEFTVFKHNSSNEIIDTSNVFEDSHPNGFIYQVQEVVRCIRKGKTESNIMPLDETAGIMEVMDKMRDAWGFRYPFE